MPVIQLNLANDCEQCSPGPALTVWGRQVISIWFEVQRTWSHLESIFIGSEDIRQQLPEDSRRFDEIDAKFKVGGGGTGVGLSIQKWRVTQEGANKRDEYK